MPILTALDSCIAQHSFATLVTSESCGSLRAAQINHPYLDNEGQLWFVAASNSFVVDNIESCPEVLVLWPQSTPVTPTSLFGSGFVITNLKIKQNIWTRAQWSTGTSDPRSGDVVLVRITPRRVEYWDAHAQRRVCLALPSCASSAAVQSAPDAVAAPH